MQRRHAIELLVVVAAFVLVGYVWLHPASRELLAGNATVMIGDASDSITNPWQYQLVLDAWRSDPWRVLFGALYTDQVTYPDGFAVFIPYSERIIVLALAPFMRVELMPTAVVWIYVVLSGLAMHACGRLLGWPRVVAFALAVAWAVCPHTRARAECHIALVGVYFAPLVVAGVRILAGSPKALGWSKRTELVVAATCFFVASMAAHYYVILLVGFAPAFIALYAVLLPNGAPRLPALKRLALAALPALVLVVSTRWMPLSPGEAEHVAAPPAAKVQEVADLSLRIYGAHFSDFAAGDVRFGDRDVNPIRSAITRSVRESVPGNYHERTNGIRWTLLGAVAVLATLRIAGRFKDKLRPDERRLATFVLIFGAVALVVSVGPTGFRHHDVDFGPGILLAKLVPAFRVPNRVGVFVHFAALLATGIVVGGLTTRLVGSRPERAWAPGVALLAVAVLEYLPLHPVIIAPVAIHRTNLVSSSGVCGAGVTVPYVTYGFQVDHYYWTMAELRGTPCKLLHATYLTPEDDALMKLTTREFTTEDLDRAVAFARCTNASWAIFRLGAPQTFKEAYCAQLGWSFVAPDACRGAPVAPGPARSFRECMP